MRTIFYYPLKPNHIDRVVMFIEYPHERYPDFAECVLLSKEMDLYTCCITNPISNTTYVWKNIIWKVVDINVLPGDRILGLDIGGERERVIWDFGKPAEVVSIITDIKRDILLVEVC